MSDVLPFADPKRNRTVVAAPLHPSFDSGCVTTDNGCVLPPIGEPVSPYSGTYEGSSWAWGCYGWCGGQSASTYYNYGSGDEFDPGAPSEGVADDQNSSCHSLQSSACNLRTPTADERAKIQAGINKMKTTGVCGYARAAAQHVLDGDHFQVWTNTVRDAQGRVVLGDADQAFLNENGTERYAYIHLWTEDMSAWTIAHEALHTLGYVHEDIIDGMTMDRYARSCVS